MTVVCCTQCYNDIARLDAKAARMWLDLCRSFVEAGGILKMRETRVPWCIPHFKNLEIMGYVLSADAPEILVRVNGYDIIELEENECLETFCMDREKHQFVGV